MSGVGIEADGLTLTLNSTRLLLVDHFHCAPGESVCLVGANGSGKSLLLEALCGAHRADGRVRWYRDAPPSRQYLGLAEVRLGTVLQRLQFWPRARVGEIISLMCSVLRRPLEIPDALKEIQRRAYKHLSSGERQLLHVTIAFNSGSDALLLDEPGLALDASNESRVLEALRRSPVTKVVSLHNFKDVLLLADRCYFIVRGYALPLRIVESTDLRRMANLHVRDASPRSEEAAEMLLSKAIEIEHADNVDRLNRQIIPIVEEYGDAARHLRLELSLSKSIFREYRHGRASSGVA